MLFGMDFKCTTTCLYAELCWAYPSKIAGYAQILQIIVKYRFMLFFRINVIQTL